MAEILVRAESGRKREAERGNIAEAFHQPPAGLAALSADHERKADRFQRFKIASYRACIFRIILWNVIDEFLEASPRRAIQLPEQIPLAGNLVVARHDAKPVHGWRKCAWLLPEPGQKNYLWMPERLCRG